MAAENGHRFCETGHAPIQNQMEHAMQLFTLIPYTILSIRFLLLLCRIPDRSLDWLLS